MAETEREPPKMAEPTQNAETSAPQKPTESSPDSRRQFVLRATQTLVHACQCKDRDCSLEGCQQMRNNLTHSKSCARKSTGDCPVCKHLIALCCYHAKHCHLKATECRVPLCGQLKQKLEQQRKLHQAEAPSQRTKTD
ncbi:hypothetical protein BaRGS_00022808 [Batillaria attramentaria]|uniref:histone acetyltransferase n=1 Tax=Batillaria attramentaria TaxID=370345 RepID=A0ABD0KFV9_9CAEN